MDYVETEGDTVDEAIEGALKTLGVARDKVTVDVLEEGTKGFLGIGAKRARIRASIRKALVVDVAEKRPLSGDALSSQDREAMTAKAKTVLSEILERMGLEARVEVKEGDAPDETVLEIYGNYGGLLIGRKGQTLEALQHLVTRIVGGREGAGSVQWIVDTENYNDRRRKNLEDTALRLGETAKRGRKTISMDNLSARERRIVHLALEDDPWLTTQSQGQGPYRRLLIIPQGDRKTKEQEKGSAAMASASKGQK